MLLGLCEVLERKKLDPLTFFRAAYQHRFGKDMDVRQDVEAWKKYQKIPAYVNVYVHHLQGELM